MKVVINSCFGGFSISEACARHMAAAGSERATKDIADHDATLAAFAYYKTHGKLPEGFKGSTTGMFDIAIKYDELPKYHGYGYVDGMDGGYQRDDPLLVAAVETLGEKAAGGQHAALRIVEIPDGIAWEIDEYDGREHIAEKHRTWA